MTKCKLWSDARQTYMNGEITNNNPIVQFMFEEMSRQQIHENEVARRVGLAKHTPRGWRVRYMPKISDVSNVLDYLGYELCIKRKRK